jgi:hypothetical protein
MSNLSDYFPGVENMRHLGSVKRTSGDLTTSSTTFIDATGMSITAVTKARRCMVVINAVTYDNTAGKSAILELDIDGSPQGEALGISFGTGTDNLPHHFTLITDELTAGEHTFKLQWKVNGGTGTLYANSASTGLRMSVFELPA